MTLSQDNQQIIQAIARKMAENHGYTFPDGDLLKFNCPRAYLFVSDAEIALKVIESFLTDNDLKFDQLVKL